MKKIDITEQKALFNHKISEGKDEIIAVKEIKRDIDFEEDFYKFKKQLDKKDRIIQQLEKKLKVLNKKLFGSKLKQGEDTGEYATTKDLTRIISILQAEKKLNLNNLRKICIINPSSKMKNALNLLVKNNITKVNVEKGVTFIEIYSP